MYVGIEIPREIRVISCVPQYARRSGIKMQDPRGSPENTGTDLTAIQLVNLMSTRLQLTWPHLRSPVIRTNPVTGFKSLFVNRESVPLINRYFNVVNQ